MAVLTIVLLNILLISIILTHFDSRIISDDPLTKNTGRIHLEFLVYKFAIIIAYNFFWTQNFTIILLIIIIGGSIHIFYRFRNYSPYYNYNYKIFWEVLTGTDLWTSVMLILANIIEGRFFNGSLLIWIFGLPFLILIISR